MKRSIITIDEDRCTGCGLCVPDCPEGALQIVDGKARLMSDLFCDGLGACLKICPEGALHVEEREAEPCNESMVMENVVKQGAGVIRAHLHHLKEHGEMKHLHEAVEYLREKGIPVPMLEEPAPVMACGCPGSAARDMRDRPVERIREGGGRIGSSLSQWPVQLKLLNPSASYFDNANILIAADCVPFAYGNFHRDMLAGRIVVMFCPKLDPYIEEYIDKLAAIIAQHEIQSITVARMEVPCCGGVNVVLERAMQKAGNQVPVREIVIGIQGDILHAGFNTSRRMR